MVKEIGRDCGTTKPPQPTPTKKSHYMPGCYVSSINTAMTCDHCGFKPHSDECEKFKYKNNAVMIGIYHT